MIRPITLYPFPSETIHASAQRMRRIGVFECNSGQMVEDVERAVAGVTPVQFYGRPGGAAPGVFGDIGGQYTMGAPIGLKTPTSPGGRDARVHGSPIPLAEMLAMMPGAAFIGRISTHDPAYVFRGQKILRKAIEANMAGAGFTFVECMTTCPTGWRMTPVEAVQYHEEVMLKERPVGIIKDWDGATHEPVEAALPTLTTSK